MIETIRPRGAIAECLIVGIVTYKGKFYVIDEQRNYIEVPEFEYQNLKGKKEIIDYGENGNTKKVNFNQL